MLDHEEKFLFKEEILHLSNALADPGILDNVEDLLTDVITSPRFDSEVFTLERSLQVMLGRARRNHPGRPADGRPRGVRRGRRGPHPARGARAPGRLARPVRARHRQRPQLPQQPRRHPGPQLRDPDRPRRGAPRPPGPADARPLQQRAAVLRRGRGRVPGPRHRRHGAARAVPRAGRRGRGDHLAAARRRPADRAQDHAADADPGGRCARDAAALPRRDRPEPRQDDRLPGPAGRLRPARPSDGIPEARRPAHRDRGRAAGRRGRRPDAHDLRARRSRTR